MMTPLEKAWWIPDVGEERMGGVEMPRPKDNPDARLTIGYSIYCLPRSGLVQPLFLTHRVSGAKVRQLPRQDIWERAKAGGFLRQRGHTKGTPPQFGLVLTRVKSWRTGSNILCDGSYGIGTRSVSS